MQEIVGLWAVGESLGLRVPIQPLASCKCDVGQVGEGRGAVAFLDVGIRALAALDAVEEVASGLLVEVAVGRLDDLALAARFGILERASALGDDFKAIGRGVDGSQRASAVRSRRRD